MAKALLINPAPEGLVGKKTRKFHRRFPPLSLLMTATLLRDQGWEVSLADLNADRSLSPSSVQAQAHQSDMVVLTTNPYADWQCPSFSIGSTLDLAKQLPGERLLITGNHGTHYPGGMMRATGALGIVREEPEWTLLEAAQALQAGRSLEGIEGLSFRQGSEHFHNPRRHVKAMEELPTPAYDLVDLGNYYYELLGGNFALLEASRGCPYSCNFCNLSMFQNKYRKSTSEKFCAQLDDLVENHGCRSLYIFDLEFTINRKMVKEICDHLLAKDYAGRYGFRWACQTRADSVTRDNMLEQMKKSGCELIHFGVEAGNEEILKNTNKRIQKDRIREGLAATRAAGIKSAAFFIFGHPQETKTHYQETLDFALELNPTFASFHPMLPFPGSPLFEQIYGEGPYWEAPLRLDLTYFTPDQERDLAWFVKKAYASFYLRPRYIKSLLKEGDWSLYSRQFNLFREFLVG